MNPVLKAPGTKRLELKYDELPSSFAFIFNLHHYTKVVEPKRAALAEAEGSLATTMAALKEKQDNLKAVRDRVADLQAQLTQAKEDSKVRGEQNLPMATPKCCFPHFHRKLPKFRLFRPSPCESTQ